MQQIVIACGYNPFGYVIVFFIVFIPFAMTLGIKWFFLAKTPRSPRRSLFLDSFGLTFIAGIVIGLVLFSFSVLPSSMLMIEIGFFYSYQIFIWAIVCIIDTLLIKRWSLKPKAQAISLSDDQQLQVEVLPSKYQAAWVVALQSNTLIAIIVALFFQMID
ncbi:hypothetical protein [Herpetosiphon gulosus]|uniref:DUF4149 domain-containing protein n=1 Tax=Herpetosiphon gulosus TaxID=1973496 RepID=A0ABP9WWU9_9CHLR